MIKVKKKKKKEKMQIYIWHETLRNIGGRNIFKVVKNNKT
jgi:hypothetical protein